MPNTGKPSRDCHLCRARRVKCDLGKPSCFRCITYGAICPGYRRDIDMMFQNENQKSLADAARKPGRMNLRGRPKHRPADSGIDFSLLEPDTSSSADSSPAPTRRARVRKSLSPSMQNASICLVQDHFSTDGFTDFLPTLFAECADQESFILATEAFAAAYRHNQSNSELDKNRSAHMYYGALQATHKALSSPIESVKDATLAAVWLLGIYEVLVGCGAVAASTNTADAYLTSSSHTHGMLTLLQLRGPEQLSSRRGRNLFWMAFSRVISESIVADMPCPPQCWDWLAALKPTLDDFDRAPHAILMHLRGISSLTYRMMHATCHSPAPHAYAMLPGLLEEFYTIDNAPSLPFDLEPLFPSQLYLWNLYRSVRAKMHQTLVLLISYVESVAAGDFPLIEHLRQQRVISVEIVRLMSQELLSSVAAEGEEPPRLRDMCWGDKLKEAFGLAYVYKICSITAEQKKVAGELLEDLVKDISVRSSLMVYPERLPWPTDVMHIPAEMLAY